MSLARAAKQQKLGKQTKKRVPVDDEELQTPRAGPSNAPAPDDIPNLRRSGRSQMKPLRFEDFEISSVSAVIRRSRGDSVAPLSTLATPLRVPSPPRIPSPPPEPQHPSAGDEQPSAGPLPPPPPAAAEPPPIPVVVRVYHKTQPNELGIFRVYDSKEPSRYPEDPQLIASPNLLSDKPPDAASLIQKTMALSQNAQPGHQKEPPKPPPYAPLPNVSNFRLFDWAYEVTSITEASLDSLVHNVILQLDFDRIHFRNFSAKRELRKLDAPLPSEHRKSSDNPTKPSLFRPKKANPTPKPSKTPPFAFDDSIWRCGTISIPMPCVGHKYASESDAPQLVIDNVWYRKPMSIIRSLVQDDEFTKLHLRPYKEFWLCPGTSQPQ
ncbi:hypothetical protein AAF712_010758 [Marasmius tenuissimus]|uniref:Uncharacterized protein n=1 Tax=Marasmius tenuissimus TaxID=585030 RepID=A0ABR2ZMF0_9AGAR